MLTLIHIRLAVMTSELKSVNLKRCRSVVKILVCAKEALSELITSTLSQPCSNWRFVWISILFQNVLISRDNVYAFSLLSSHRSANAHALINSVFALITSPARMTDCSFVGQSWSRQALTDSVTSQKYRKISYVSQSNENCESHDVACTIPSDGMT